MASLLLAAGFACAGPREVQEPTKTKALTATELRDLLAQHTIEPVRSMEGDDPFAGAKPEMHEYADPAKAAALKSDAGAQAAAQPASGAASSPAGAQNPATTGENPPAAPTASEPANPPQQKLEPPPPAQEKPAAAPSAQPDAQKPAPAENPYLRFGERIKVNPDGTITKPFPLRQGTGKNLQTLIVNYGNFPLWTDKMGPGPSTPNTVKIDLLEGWDVELYQDLRAPVAVPTPAPVADWLVVTASAELLGEVEDFINLFAAAVPQIEIEAKVVEISLSDVLDLGVTPVAPNTPIFDFPGSGTFVRSLDYSFPKATSGIGALLTIGSIQNGTAFNAVIEAIQGHENVSIINQPKIAVREGSRAEINALTKIPFLEVSGISAAGSYTANVKYQDVGVKLYVIPRVVGTQTVALNIDIEASQQTGTQVAFVAPTSDPQKTQPISVPVLSSRSAKTIVYLQPGQAVILGGLITERTVERINKVPLLGDIPLLQYLFRSKNDTKEQTNVLFFIRPRILQGVDLHRQF
jgi:type II secretory pathway component GspD/PulD (secretin)